MSGDIEDFLRRAAERRQQRQAGKAPAPPVARQRPEYSDASRERNVSRRDEDDDLDDVLPAEAIEEPLSRRIAELKRKQAEAQSTRSVGRESSVGRNSPQTQNRNAPPAQIRGSNSRGAEPKEPRRAAAKADDPIATIAPAKSYAAPPPASTTVGVGIPELLRMLQTPHGLRNAILIREILERPEHRW